jgi:excisionase family DNA binding protein
MKRERLLSIPEVCELVALEEWAVRRMLRTGEIPGFKVGYVWRIPPAGLRRKFGPDILPVIEPVNV